MKALLPFLLLAMTSVVSATEIVPCDTPTARLEMAASLRLASEDRPVNINLRTGAEGVKVPPYLVKQHPDDLWIVRQYQFAQLNVRDDRFEVVLWFKGYPERLVVPFNAIKAFYDKGEPKCFEN